MDPAQTFKYMDNIREHISQKIMKTNKKAEDRYVRNYNKQHEIPTSDPFQVGVKYGNSILKMLNGKRRTSPTGMGHTHRWRTV